MANEAPREDDWLEIIKFTSARAKTNYTKAVELASLGTFINEPEALSAAQCATLLESCASLDAAFDHWLQTEAFAEDEGGDGGEEDPLNLDF